MKKLKPLFLISSLLFIAISCHQYNEGHTQVVEPYKSEDPELYEAIVAMDKEFFKVYNNCDMEKQEAIYADNIEFFHDKGGLSTSKQEILEGTKANICGKVTRELVEGTIEVYPIHNYGAVEIGYHRFHNKEEPDAESKASKFIAVWSNSSGNWQMTKVISLH